MAPAITYSSARRAADRHPSYRPSNETPLDADRLRALAADLAACGSVQTAAIVQQLAAELQEQ